MLAVGLATGLSLLAMRASEWEGSSASTPCSRSQMTLLLEQKVVQTQEEIRQLVLAAHANLPARKPIRLDLRTLDIRPATRTP